MSAGGTRLLLASASPRRRQLLVAAGYDFEVMAPSVVERESANLSLRELTSGNALRKGLAIARTHPGCIVLAADTLVALDRRVIGKPADRADAVRLLRLLSGRTHLVATGVFVGHLRRGKSITFTVLSQVTFGRLSEQMIEDYLATIDPLDKAGGYAAQDAGGSIIRQIAGSRSNVIGLPLEETSEALARFGVRPARPQALSPNAYETRTRCVLKPSRRPPSSRRSRRSTR